MAFPSSSDIAAHIDPLAAAEGLAIEEIAITRAGAKSAVRIIVDAADPRAASPDLDALERLSGVISGTLDAAEEDGTLNFGPGYTLEVTTPGVGTPLTHARHWIRALSRRVILSDGREGRVLQVSEAPSSAGEAEAQVEVALWALEPSGGKGGAGSKKGKKGKKKASAGAEATEAGAASASQPWEGIVILPLAEVAGAVVDVEFAEVPREQADAVDLPWSAYVG